MLVVSVLEGLYIIYMFIFFKTCYSLEIGRLQLENITRFFSNLFKFNVEKLLYHPTQKCAEPESQICLFGKYAAILIFVFLVMRHFCKGLKKINVYVFLVIFLFSLMNYNAVLYLVPVFILEILMGSGIIKFKWNFIFDMYRKFLT